MLVVADVDYDTYNKGASYLSWFLTPATVCLAIPLYEQWTPVSYTHLDVYKRQAKLKLAVVGKYTVLQLVCEHYREAVDALNRIAYPLCTNHDMSEEIGRAHV